MTTARRPAEELAEEYRHTEGLGMNPHERKIARRYLARKYRRDLIEKLEKAMGL